ncbi:hypothetical protein B5X24_HaOG215825, partial [Helicoverpa armigera]
PDEKAPISAKPDEKALSPDKEEERKLSVISLDEKAPSPVKSEDKAPSPVKHEEKTPSPVKPDEKEPSPAKFDEKATSPVELDEKVPSPAKPDEETPSPIKLDEKAPSPVKYDEKAPSPVKPDLKGPSYTKPDEKEPSSVKEVDKVPIAVEADKKALKPLAYDDKVSSPVKLDEKAPSPAKTDEKVTIPIKPDEREPSLVKLDEKAQSPVKEDEIKLSAISIDDKAPSPAKPDDKAPRSVKPDEKAPISTKPDEKEPSPVKSQEKAPSPVEPDEEALSPIKPDEKTPSPVKPDEKMPSSIKPDEKAPSPTKPDEEEPRSVKEDERKLSAVSLDVKAPSPVEPKETTISSIKLDEKEHSPVKSDDKAPSSVMPDEKAPISTKSDDKEPSVVKEDERKLSAVSLDVKAPSLVEPKETSTSSIKLDEKEHSPVKPDEKGPSPDKEEERKLRAISLDEKAPSPFKSEDKAPSPVKPDEKMPSPVKPDEKVPSSVKPAEKAPSPIKPDEEEPSSVKEDERKLSAVSLDVKAPSPVEQKETAATLIKRDEKEPSPVKSEEKLPSPIKSDEKTLKPLEHDEKGLSSIKPDEEAPSSVKPDEKAPSPAESDEEAPSPIKSDEKAPSPTKPDEKEPSPVKEDERKLSAISLDAKAPSPVEPKETVAVLIKTDENERSPVKQDEKPQSSVKLDEKAPSPVEADEKALKPLEHDDKVPSPVKHDEKAPSPVKPDEKEPSSLKYDEDSSPVKVEDRELSLSETDEDLSSITYIEKVTKQDDSSHVTSKQEQRLSSPDKTLGKTVEEKETSASKLDITSVDTLEEKLSSVSTTEEKPAITQQSEELLDEDGFVVIDKNILDEHLEHQEISPDMEGDIHLKDRIALDKITIDKTPQFSDAILSQVPVKEPKPEKEAQMKEDVDQGIKPEDDLTPEIIKKELRVETALQDQFDDDVPSPELVLDTLKELSPIKDDTGVVIKETIKQLVSEKEIDEVTEIKKTVHKEKVDELKSVSTKVTDITPISDELSEKTQQLKSEQLTSEIMESDIISDKLDYKQVGLEKDICDIKKDKKTIDGEADAVTSIEVVKQITTASNQIDKLIHHDQLEDKTLSPIEHKEEIATIQKETSLVDEKKRDPDEKDEKGITPIKLDKLSDKTPSPAESDAEILSPALMDDSELPAVHIPQTKSDKEKSAEIETVAVKADDSIKHSIKLPTESLVDEKSALVPITPQDESEIEKQLEGFEPVGEIEEDTTTQIVTITEGGQVIKRKSTITTIIQEYSNVSKTIRKYKITVISVESDEHLDGTKVSRTYKDVSIADSRPKTSTFKIEVKEISPIQDGSDIRSDLELTYTKKTPSPLKEDQKESSPDTLEKKVPRPQELGEDGESGITPEDKVPSPIKRDELSSSPMEEKLISFLDDLEIEERLKDFKPTGESEEKTITQYLTITEKGVEILRTFIITTIVQKYYSISRTTVMYKIIIVTVEEDELPDGTKVSRTYKKTSLSNSKPTLEQLMQLCNECVARDLHLKVSDFSSTKPDDKYKSTDTFEEKKLSPIKPDEKTDSLVKPDDKDSSLVKLDDKEGSPVKDDGRKLSSVSLEVTAPSPVKPGEEASSPVKPDEKSPSPVKPAEKAPSPVKPDEKVPSPIKTDEKAPSPVKPEEKAPSSLKIDDKEPSPVKSDEEEPSPVDHDDKLPSPPDEKTPSPVKSTEKISSPIEQDDKLPSPVKTDEKAPSPVQPEEKVPSPVKADDREPSPVKPDARAPSPVKPEEKVHSSIDIDHKPPSPVKSDEKEPSPAKPDEKATSPVQPEEKVSSPIKADDKEPSPVKPDEKEPSPVKPDEKVPSPVKPDDKLPSPVKTDEKVPIPVQLEEKIPSPVMIDDKVASPIKIDDKLPSPVKSDEKEPSPVKSDEKAPIPVKPDEKVPIPVQLEEKIPSPVMIDDKVASPIKIDDKLPSPVKTDDKEPSPVKPDEKLPSPVKPDEKEPSPVKPDEKEPSPVKPDEKPDEKTPSPVKSTEKISSPIEQDDKLPSPIKADVKEPSPVKTDDKEPSPVKPEERAPSPAKLDEKVPSPVKPDEKVPSPAKPDEKEPSPVKPDEKVASPVKPDEQEPSPVKPDDKLPSPDKTDEKVPIPVQLEEKIPSPVKIDEKPDEKVPSPIQHDEKVPSPVKIEDKESTPAKADDKEPSPVKPDEKAPSPVKPEEKVPSSIEIDDKVPSPVKIEDKESTPVKPDEKVLSPVKIDDKEPILVKPDEKPPSPIKADEKVPSPIEHDDKLPSPVKLDEKAPSLVKLDVKEVSHAKPDEKEHSPVKPEDREPGPVKPEEKVSSPAKPDEKVPSSIDIDGKEPSPVKPDEKVPSPVKPEDKVPSSIEIDDKVPSPVKIEDKESTPVKPDEKVSSPIEHDDKLLSPVKTDDKVPSPVKPDDKEPSPVKPDEKAPSPVKPDEKAPSPVKPDEKAPSPVKPDEKAPSPVTPDEKVSSPIEHDDKLVSTVKTDDKEPSPVKPDEKAPSLVKPDEKVSSPVKMDDKEPSPVKPDEKAPSPVKPDEKVPAPIKPAEQEPSPVSEDVRKLSASSLEEQAPIPVEPEVKVPSPIKLDKAELSPDKPLDKVPSPVMSDKTTLSSIKHDVKLPSPDKADDKVASPVKHEKSPETDKASEKSEVTKKEIEAKSKDDEKDIDEKESFEDESTSSKKVSVGSEKDLISKSDKQIVDSEDDQSQKKSADGKDLQDFDTTEKDIYDDGESISEDSQIIERVDLQKESFVQPAVTKIQSLSSQTEELLKQERQFVSKLEPGLKETVSKPHVVKKRSILDDRSTQDSLDSLTDGLTSIPHGSSSEDVSKETSLEEKYSFEGSEKSEKKSVRKLHADDTTSHKVEPLSIDDSFTSTLKDTDLTKVQDDKTQELGSPKDEIPLSEASDSGVHSIPTDVGLSDDKNITQAITESAVHLMESIQKAFEEDTVQQGIKTESLESLVRVSTPPTVPVSPLPKTPSSFQDVKISDGVQSEVTYDKSDGSEETITKVVHVGDDVLTQRISTSTEKVPKKTTALVDDESDLLSLMQNVGKIKTETDTVTKIIKEGENVVTQTITTVTTKEVISREDGTPQNIKTTIETTTLSKGSDGSTTTIKDTQTLLSECSSSLRSTSSMDLYAKDRIDKEYLESEEKFDIRDLTDKRESSLPKDVESLKSFLSETDESDDNIEDTIIDTDVSKRIIKENNKDIVETVTTTTKKETIKVSDHKKIIRTTVETNVAKEHPDGSRDVQKNVEVKTEEIILDSSSNLDNILNEFIVCGEPEESVTSKTEEIKQDTFTIRRTIVTRVVKTKYADKQGIPRKLKTDTTITTTDDYPDGSSRTKVDSSTSLSDIDIEPVETPELQDLTVVEDKAVETDRNEKTVSINGKSALQIITTTTTKETLASIDRTKRKLKTTVETVTETMLPDGMTEVTKDVKISVSDIGLDTVEDSLDGFESIGKPKEDTTTETETVTEDGLIIKRKTTVTTTTQEYINISNTIKRVKTTVKTVVEDEHPDGSVIKKTSEKISLTDENLITTSDDSEDEKINAILKDLISSEPDVSESVQKEEIKEKDITIHRTIVTKIVTTKYSDSRGQLQKIKTVTTVTTSDQYPDGTTKITVDTNTTINDLNIEEEVQTKKKVSVDQSTLPEPKEKDPEPIVNGVHESLDSETFIEGKSKTGDKLTVKEEAPSEEEPAQSSKVDAALKDFIPEGEPEITESSETIDIKEKDTVIRRIIVTKIVKTKYSDKQGNLRKLKTVTTLTTTDNYPDGSARTTVESSTSVTDIEIEITDVVEEGFDAVGDPIEDTTTETKSITENGIVIKRKTTITTIVQEYASAEQNIKRTKTTIRTVIEDEYPDGSVTTRASEKVSLVDESLKAPEPTAEELAEIRKLEAALQDLSPSGEPEVSEDTKVQEIKEDGVSIRRVINTKIVKTKYSDSKNIIRKMKTVKTVTTTDEFPDGAARTTVDTSTSVCDIKEDNVEAPVQQVTGYDQVGDVQINVETINNAVVRDGKELQQTITIKTTKEVLESQQEDIKRKVRTTVETESQIALPDGNTEITRDKKVTLDDFKSETFYENLTGYVEIDKPKESVETEEDTISENGVKINRKTTMKTIKQEFENAATLSRKVKSIIRVEIEDEHPDGTVITKKKETVTITDIAGYPPRSMQDAPGRPEDLPVGDSEIVESQTEDLDVKNEEIQRGSITIKRKITTKTKREFLASNDVNIKRVRTTVETTTIDEYPDGATETTKDVKITVSEFQKTSDSDLQAALQGLEPTGKIKTSVDKKTNIIKSEHGEKITQTITTNVTKEELSNSKTNDVAVKTVTETITENAKDDGTVETTKDVRTQITYLPPGTGLDDWSPEELEEIEKQPVAQEERQVLDDKPAVNQKQHDSKEKQEQKPKKQRSPVGEITTETDTYTKVIKEGDNEITQTITVVTTKEVISPEKIKVTVETTTVSKGSDGVTKTTKSTKTTISEFREEFEETVDTGESEKSFSKLSSKTGDMRSSSAASDDLDHPGIATPPSDISSRGSRAATHIWGTESSGMYYSDEEGQGSPSSTKSQIAHSPRSNLSFELDTARSQQDLFEKHESGLDKDIMTTSLYGHLPEDDSCKSSSHSEVTTTEVLSGSATKLTKEFLSKERSEHIKHSDATFLKEADEHFEKAIEEHKKVSGSQVISNITAKYELDSKFHSSSSHSSKEESTITLKDIKTESKKLSDSSSSSKQETKLEQSEMTSETRKTSKDPIESWGKPLGLPSPIGPPTQTDGKSTPKKQSSATVLNKNKINQEKSKEAKGRASESPSKKKAPAPVYMELTYVPHHGNSYYSAIEFFKRVRARYYVFSGTEPSKEIYNALLDAKKTWEDKDLEVTIIPTYDTDVLGYWVTENEEALEKYKIDLSPSASRCTINLQDHETSCAAYRLEF